MQPSLTKLIPLDLVFIAACFTCLGIYLLWMWRTQAHAIFRIWRLTGGVACLMMAAVLSFLMVSVAARKKHAIDQLSTHIAFYHGSDYILLVRADGRKIWLFETEDRARKVNHFCRDWARKQNIEFRELGDGRLGIRDDTNQVLVTTVQSVSGTKISYEVKDDGQWRSGT